MPGPNRKHHKPEQRDLPEHWRKRCCLLLWLLLPVTALVACDGIITPEPVPTSTLIPATPVPTATPITPTATLRDLPAPGDITGPTPTPAPALNPLLQTDLIPDTDLTDRIIVNLADDLAISPDQIQPVSIEARTWFNDEPGCLTTLPPPRQPRLEGYRYVLLAGMQLHVYHTSGTDRFERCESQQTIVSDDLLLQIDPAAAELAALARRRVATELDLPVQRVRLVSIRPYTWTESSLGCPQPDQTYSTVSTEGYRIVVRAGEQDYLFHTDTATLFTCDPEREVLPE